jgi:CHAT domain-containing protein/tetratricopeptide (TPR) repeat protein
VYLTVLLTLAVALQTADAQRRLQTTDAVASSAAAVEKFVAMSDPGGEAEARVALGVALNAAGRAADAWREVPRVLEAARRSGNPHLIARGLVYEAWLAHQTGERLGRAIRALREAESLVFPAGPYPLRLRVLLGLGNVSLELGRYDAALTSYAQLVELARGNHDAQMLALASANVLTARRKQMEVRPDPARLPEFTTEARRLATLAGETGDSRLQAVTQRALADLLASTPATRPESQRHYQAALEYARKSGDPIETAASLWALGRFLSDVRPAESRRFIDEALEMAVHSGSANSVAYAWRQQMQLAWKALPRDRAIVESFRALDAIETLRALQDADLARASVLGAWTADYYRLIGRLLREGSSSAETVSQAFAVSERMRARSLLDSLQRPRAAGNGRDGRRRELLQGISSIQRQLLNPALQGASRSSALAELERLERAEADARADGRSTDRPLVGSGDLTSLEAISRSLGADEAMLSFSVGVEQNFYGDFAGGAWLLLTTRDGTRVFDVPDRTRLEPMVTVFRGLVERAAQIDDGPAVALYEALLGDALAALPTAVTRLVVIPDGVLHHLPFAALRASPQSPPVGSQFEIVVAPSATVWSRLSRGAPVAGDGAVLVLADPLAPPDGDARAQREVARDRDWSLDGAALGRLAYAREEGHSVVARMGGASRLLTGSQATESAVKTLPDHFSILHFATHALMDETHPERSAVLLSVAAGGDDGLLQAREIAELSLDGRVVVLSACRSATGAVLGGEGVVGLSRAFFEAGARTVVGTLWAVRDDHAAYFAEAVYGALGEGRSVGAAVRDARRRAVDAGIPAAAWAAYVVVGDDRITPHPAAPGRALGSAVTGASLTVGVLSVALLGIWLWLRRTGGNAQP